MIKHATSTKNVEHGIEGKSSVVETFSSASVMEEFEGVRGVGVAEADPLEDLVDQFVREENSA